MTRMWACLVCMVLLVGCSESVMIRSSPSGAKVYVNDRPTGMTPVVFSVKKGDLEHTYNLRLEKDGYDPYAGALQTHFAGGRATGAFFTLGLVYLFKSPRTLVPPPLIVLQPSLEAERDRRVGKELREIERLHAEGKITQEEVDRRKKELLDEQ